MPLNGKDLASSTTSGQENNRFSCDIGQMLTYSPEYNLILSNVLSSRVTNYKNDIHKFS